MEHNADPAAASRLAAVPEFQRILDRLERELQEIERELNPLCAVLTSHNYVVQKQGDANLTLVPAPGEGPDQYCWRSVSPLGAPRWTARDAARIAEHVKGVAVGYLDAARAYREHVTRMLPVYRAGAAGRQMTEEERAIMGV